MCESTLPTLVHRELDSLRGHSLEHTKRFIALDREEKWEGGDRGDMGEKRESQKGERIIKAVITLLSKNGY